MLPSAAAVDELPSSSRTRLNKTNPDQKECQLKWSNRKLWFIEVGKLQRHSRDSCLSRNLQMLHELMTE